MSDTQTTDNTHPVDVTTENFNEFISQGYTFMDFWAPWCTPCKMVAPTIDELAKEWKGKIKFGKLNTDDHGMVAMQYGIMGIPTFILFKDGQPVDRMTGAAPKPMFTQMLTRNYEDVPPTQFA